VAKEVYTARDLREVVGLGRTTIWRLEKDGRFPKRRQLSDRRVGWLRKDVEEWAENRAEKE